MDGALRSSYGKAQERLIVGMNDLKKAKLLGMTPNETIRSRSRAKKLIPVRARRIGDAVRLDRQENDTLGKR